MGAFPPALPLRLVLMFSIYGDRVLDPFLGTGTTALAAALTGRNAVGYDVDAALPRCSKASSASSVTLARAEPPYFGVVCAKSSSSRAACRDFFVLL